MLLSGIYHSLFLKKDGSVWEWAIIPMVKNGTDKSQLKFLILYVKPLLLATKCTRRMELYGSMVSLVMENPNGAC